MKLKLSLCAIFILSAGHLLAQKVVVNPFDNFANNQSGLIQKAYEKRDDEEGLKLMTEMMVKYRELDVADKQMLKGYLTNNWYNISCLYSLVNKKPEALSTLDSAVHFGYINYAHLMEDNDFANIKNEPKFKKIAEGVRSVGDYKYILQKAAKFNAGDARKFPVFTYQSASDANLIAVRKTLS